MEKLNESHRIWHQINLAFRFQKTIIVMNYQFGGFIYNQASRKMVSAIARGKEKL